MSSRFTTRASSPNGMVPFDPWLAWPSVPAGAGLESALAYCVVDYFGSVVPFHKHDWRQPRSPSRSSKRQRTEALPGCWASVKVCVRTGGRLHSGLAGERLLKQNAHWSTWRDAEVAAVYVYVLVVNCVSDVLFHEHAQRQPRPPTFRSKRQLAQAKPGCSGLGQGKGDRTGGRPHPGQAGARLLNNAQRHDAGCVTILEPGASRPEAGFAFGGAHGGGVLVCVALKMHDCRVLTQSCLCVTVPFGAPTVLGDCVSIALLGACPRPYQCNDCRISQ